MGLLGGFYCPVCPSLCPFFLSFYICHIGSVEKRLEVIHYVWDLSWWTKAGSEPTYFFFFSFLLLHSSFVPQWRLHAAHRPCFSFGVLIRDKISSRGTEASLRVVNHTRNVKPCIFFSGGRTSGPLGAPKVPRENSFLSLTIFFISSPSV
jgi:hypothetical protein